MNLLQNQSGQQTFEALLLMITFLVLTLFLSHQFQSRNLFARMLSDPWASVQGMTESGVWAPVSSARAVHPNHFGRHSSVTGLEVRKPQ